MCSKINNQTFDSEKERKAYTSAEYYEFSFGEDYEKEIRAVFDRGLLNNFDGTLGELEKVKRYFFDKLDRSPRQTCNHCRKCFNECVIWKDFPGYMKMKTQFEEMIGIVATRRPLLFDMRITSDDYCHYFEDKDAGDGSVRHTPSGGPTIETLDLWHAASLEDSYDYLFS